MLNARLAELAQKPTRRSWRGGASRGGMCGAAKRSSLNALVQGGRHRPRPRGGRCSRPSAWRGSASPRPNSIGRSATCCGGSSSSYAERNKQRVRRARRPSSSGTSCRATRCPASSYEYALHQRFLPEITLAEVNALADDWLADRNRVVHGRSRRRRTAWPCPTSGACRRHRGQRGAGRWRRTSTRADTKPLLEPLPAPGTRREARRTSGCGITEWRLSNGVRVALKPTDFKQDEIVFRAASAPAARRSPATPTTSRPARPARWLARAASARSARSTCGSSWPARSRRRGSRSPSSRRTSRAAPRARTSRRCSS